MAHPHRLAAPRRPDRRTVKFCRDLLSSEMRRSLLDAPDDTAYREGLLAGVHILDREAGL